MPTINRRKYTYQRPNKVHDPYYDSSLWRNITRTNKEANPFCFYCERKGIVTIGNTTDHQLPRRLFPELSEEPSNLKTICDKCDAKKRERERHCKTKADCYEILKEFL
jgi:5-methylcytosine-specific restriction endonuclease McrA